MIIKGTQGKIIGGDGEIFEIDSFGIEIAKPKITDRLKKLFRRKRTYTGSFSGHIVSLQEQINEWQRATFPNAEAEYMFAHLRKEVGELAVALGVDSASDMPQCENSAEEAADCAMLLFGIAGIMGFDLLAEVRRKLAVNKTRKWGEPDADGVVEHIRGDE